MPTSFIKRATQACLFDCARATLSVHSCKFWMYLFLCLLSLSLSHSAAAHPMGNFSVNHFSGIELHPTFVRVLYIIDMAEIPTFQEMQDHGLNTQPDDPAVVTYRDNKIEEFRKGLALQVDGRALTLTTKTSSLSFPPGAGGLSLYTVTPCRVLDSRLPTGSPPLSVTRDVNVTASPCGIPATAQAFVFNATVVPPGPLGYITMWPQGQTQPLAATLNAYDGAVTNNMAIVPTTTGSVSVFPSNPTHLVLDIFGYFAP